MVLSMISYEDLEGVKGRELELKRTNGFERKKSYPNLVKREMGGIRKDSKVEWKWVGVGR